MDINLGRWMEGVRVLAAEGETEDEALNLIFRNLFWQGKYIESGDIVPEQLKEEFGQLLFQLLDCKGITLDIVRIKRLSGRGERVVCYLDVWQVMEDYSSPIDFPCTMILKFGRKHPSSGEISEEYRWRHYVAPFLNTRNIAVLYAETQTQRLQGISYSYEGDKEDEATLLADALGIISLFPQRTRNRLFYLTFSKVRGLLSPWKRSVELVSADVGAYARTFCSSRVGKIHERLLPLAAGMGKIEVFDEDGSNRILQNPLILLDPGLRATVPLFSGMCHGDLTQGNVVLHQGGRSSIRFLPKGDLSDAARSRLKKAVESMHPLLIDFALSGPGGPPTQSRPGGPPAQSRPGGPLADWASLEYSCLMDPRLGGMDGVAQLFLQESLSEKLEVNLEASYKDAAIFSAVKALRAVVAEAVCNDWRCDPDLKAIMAGYYLHLAALALQQVGAYQLTQSHLRRSIIIAGFATEAVVELLGLNV